MSMLSLILAATLLAVLFAAVMFGLELRARR
jgi:hypothetical protein